jgi:hypothetical protein
MSENQQLRATSMFLQKVKAKLSLSTLWWHTGVVEIQIHSFLSLKLDGVEFSFYVNIFNARSNSNWYMCEWN